MRRRMSAAVLRAVVTSGTVGVSALLAEAKGKTRGKPVTNFKTNKALHDANKKSDRDKDGISCEKR